MITFRLGSKELVLAGPEFGDEDRTAHRRVNRESRGGDRIVKAITGPPRRRIRTLVWRFENLKEPERQAALSFFNDTAGKVLTVTDHYNVVRQMVVLNPQAGPTTPRITGSDLELELEVVP